MTGWVANHYWWRYLYTQDRHWLRTEGYPVVRDCALFYLDFLEKGEDGSYHAFPSGQGEYAFTGRLEDYTDQPQVVRHARYCLQCAVEAAGLLGLDEDLQRQWQERLDHLAIVDDLDGLGFSAEEKRRYPLNAPEFTSWDSGSIPRPGAVPAFLNPSRSNALWLDYFGQFPWCLMIHLRNRVYDPERDLEAVRSSLRRWRLPNGVLQAMAAGNNGFMGAYLESTGILGPLQEMMLQSWDGAIRLFPSWPRDLACSIRTLRAEGAFLVSASWRSGRWCPLPSSASAAGDVALPPLVRRCESDRRGRCRGRDLRRPRWNCFLRDGCRPDLPAFPGVSIAAEITPHQLLVGY